MEVSHGMASRSACDSFIVEIGSDSGKGFGEALVRDYVSGSLGEDAEHPDRLGIAAGIVRRLAARLLERTISWTDLRAWLEDAEVENHELPLLCGLEGALLDCACREAETDIYGLLGFSPASHEVIYGGTLPILPIETSKKFIGLFKSFGLPNVRVKLDGNPSYAESILGIVRGAFGDGFDVRVDANACWSYADALGMLPLLRKFGVRIIEEPFGRNEEDNRRFAREPAAREFTLAADESALTVDDVRAIAADGTFGLINIRLAKNGGLLRALAMRDAARERGLGIQAGCHVGETGILSAEGRVAASLMPDALYVDGSYDGYILSGNITTENYTFGHGGKAPVVSGRRLGYTVDEAMLKEFENGQRTCLS